MLSAEIGWGYMAVSDEFDGAPTSKRAWIDAIDFRIQRRH